MTCSVSEGKGHVITWCMTCRTEYDKQVATKSAFCHFVWHGMVCYSIVWYDVVWYDLVWYGMLFIIWHGVVLYGAAWFGVV